MFAYYWLKSKGYRGYKNYIIFLQKSFKQIFSESTRVMKKGFPFLFVFVHYSRGLVIT